MANQMIALGVRAPQAVDLGGAATRYGNMMTQRAQMEAYKQDAASKQLEREQKQARAKAYAASINPQTGEIDQAALIKNLQASGLGDAIPGALDDLAKSGRSRAEAKTADLTYVKNFNDNAIKELTGALSPDQAIAAASRLKARFPDLGGKIDELMQTLPQDPAKYGSWRDDQLFQSMEADKQLTRDLTTQNLGTSTRIVETQKYRPGAAATVVPGSEAAIAPDLKPMAVEGLGVVGYDPATNTYTPATSGGASFSGGGIPGPRGGGGGVATALQTNPGALKDGAFARSQPGYKGNSGGFAVFETPQQGVAAQENLLQSRYLGRGLNTVDKIINTYAPQGPENSADSVRNYKSYIAQRAGVNVNQPLSARDIPAVAAAMREFETGQRPGGRKNVGAPATQGMTTADMAAENTKRRAAQAFLETAGVNLKTGADPVEKLIKSSTGGAVEALGANIVGAIPENWGGGATAGAKAIGELETVAAKITTDILGGKLGTGISNEDRNMIQRMVGDIANPNIPVGKRLAAWQRVKGIQMKYLGAQPSGSSAPTTGGRRPLSSFGGRKK
jgi:hypothetical protein